MFRSLSLLLFVLLASFAKPSHPFDYDLHLNKVTGSSEVMICLHGMGGNYTIGEVIQAYGFTDQTLISFDFPGVLSYGTIQEILPVLYVLKKTIVDEGRKKVNLYGFSAGGGAVVNTLAVLNTNRFDPELEKIGLGSKEKQKVLEVLKEGRLILDAPLKSVDEIIAFRGSSPEFEFLSAQYKKNRMNPIDAIDYLKDLPLHWVVCFRLGDEILSNRDDDLFFKKLETVNSQGTTTLVRGEGSHAFPHYELWDLLRIGTH